MRRVSYIALCAVLAAVGGVLWLNAPSTPAPLSEFQEASEVMRQWSAYAVQVPWPQDRKVESAEKAVDLMNQHSGRAFRDRPIRFVLWREGDTPVPGYQVNPAPLDWKSVDESVAKARLAPDWPAARGSLAGAPVEIPGLIGYPPAPRNTLDAQTTDLLADFYYRARLVGDCVYVCRRDAFLPRLVTRKLYLISSLPPHSYASCKVLPDGRYDIADLLKVRAIDFAPGATAFLDPKTDMVTLTLDEENLDLAATGIFCGGCTGIASADSRTERIRTRWSYWVYDQKVRMRERLGLPPP